MIQFRRKQLILKNSLFSKKPDEYIIFNFDKQIIDIKQKMKILWIHKADCCLKERNSWEKCAQVRWTGGVPQGLTR
jgi:predicted transport protein